MKAESHIWVEISNPDKNYLMFQVERVTQIRDLLGFLRIQTKSSLVADLLTPTEGLSDAECEVVLYQTLKLDQTIREIQLS